MSTELSESKENIDEQETEESAEIDPEETVVMDDGLPTDNVGDVSVEINVEELIADIEKENDEDVARKKEIRRRLEDVAEEQSMEDTFAIDLGDED